MLPKLREFILLNCLMVITSGVFAQIGGQRSYEFQNVPSNTRLTGLGGVNVSIANEDINLAFANPALTSDTLSGMVSFNYLSYFAGINAGSFIYQQDLGKYGHWYIGAQHFDYGDFEGRDASGNPTSDFRASEGMVTIGRSHTAGNFTLGAGLKFLYSSIESYNSSALAVDIGGVFQHPDKELNVGLVFKNIGVILSDYTDTGEAKLPFDIRLGTTFKPEFMPFRFSFTAYNLYQGDIAYYNGTSPDPEEEPGVADKILRHLNFGAELLLSKNVNLRFGYNHLVRQELKLEDTGGGSGFSFGLMFRVKAFEFSYSRGGYHAAGGSHNFGITANTNLLFKRNR